MGPTFLHPLSSSSEALTGTHGSGGLLANDDDVLAASKPAGMLVHNSAFAGPREPSLTGWVSEQLGAPAFPLHRLDRATSGVVLFVREAAQVAAWQTALTRSQKTYIAVARGRTLEPGVIDHPVRSDRGERKDAVTRVVEVLPSTVERCSRVVLEPQTGRHHQLRQHLKHRSHPILLDSNYGDLKENRRIKATWGLGRLALHCWRIVLRGQGGEGAERVYEAPLPSDLLAFLAAVGIAPLPAQGDGVSLRPR